MRAEDWKNLALWLLDCEAATANRLAAIKSASKSEKRRHGLICGDAVRMIEAGEFTRRRSDCYSVVQRSKRAVMELIGAVDAT